MVSLPIPITKWEKFELYYIQTDMNTGEYHNYKLSIDKIRDTDRVVDLRKKIKEVYGYDESSYLISWVFDNKLVTFFHANQPLKEISN